MQGCFHVAAQQPVLYTVQESLNLLSLDNQVTHCPMLLIASDILLISNVMCSLPNRQTLCYSQLAF